MKRAVLESSLIRAVMSARDEEIEFVHQFLHADDEHLDEAITRAERLASDPEAGGHSRLTREREIIQRAMAAPAHELTLLCELFEVPDEPEHEG